MAADPQDWFTIQYEREAHLIFQQETAILMGTMRTVRNVTGNQVRFPTLGAVSAVQKARHADLVPVDPAHATVTATLQDWHVPILIDDLDELKTNVDYRSIYVRDSMAAATRKAQEIAITAMTTGATSTSGTDTDGLTLNKIRTVIAAMDDNNVPQENRWAAIDPRSFQRLTLENQFVNSDFVEMPMMPGQPRVRHWNGINWRVVTDLQQSASSTATYCLFYHRDAVGLGIGKDISVRIERVAMKDADLVNHKLSMGSVVIDTNGIFIVPVLTTQSLSS